MGDTKRQASLSCVEEMEMGKEVMIDDTSIAGAHIKPARSRPCLSFRLSSFRPLSYSDVTRI